SPISADEHSRESTWDKSQLKMPDPDGGVVRSPRVVAQDVFLIGDDLAALVEEHTIGHTFRFESLCGGPQPRGPVLLPGSPLVQNELSLAHWSGSTLDQIERVLLRVAVETRYQIDILILVREGFDLRNRSAACEVRICHESSNRNLLTGSAAVKERQ